MTRSKKKVNTDNAWPPAGVRDLKPDVPVSSRIEYARFPTLREAIERIPIKPNAPATSSTLTDQAVHDVLRQTRSRAVQYLCRAYLQFGSENMSVKDMERLCTAVSARAPAI